MVPMEMEDFIILQVWGLVNTYVCSLLFLRWIYSYVQVYKLSFKYVWKEWLQRNSYRFIHFQTFLIRRGRRKLCENDCVYVFVYNKKITPHKMHLIVSEHQIYYKPLIKWVTLFLKIPVSVRKHFTNTILQKSNLK